MSGDIDFSTATLRAGAREARAVADTVGLARQAAGAALPGNAFGVICSPLFLPIYTVVQTAADLMMASAESAIGRASANLGGTADTFDTLEADNVSTFGAVAN